MWYPGAMPGLGTLVNMGAVLVGTVVGLFFGRLIPERVRATAMAAIGLSVLGLGLQMALDPRIDPDKLRYAGTLPYHPNPLIVIGGLVLGGILGELLELERALERVGRRLQQIAPRLRPAAQPGAAERQGIVEGFVTASLLYCVGAMSVIGSIQDGTGQPQVLYVKALLDGTASVVLGSALGAGVGLSALPLGLYQGGITLAASSVTRYLTLPVLTTLTSAGGLLIAAIGLDLLAIKRLPVGNLLPGIFIASALAYFFG
ncbi:MAG TPA: DUF554 domain-containing protein [Anaeromyxobacteraceae bacterium]|nr:DUF554 domain-containing protein [Anaeromyxobacteraceae bacterium]